MQDHDRHEFTRIDTNKNRVFFGLICEDSCEFVSIRDPLLSMKIPRRHLKPRQQIAAVEQPFCHHVHHLSLALDVAIALQQAGVSGGGAVLLEMSGRMIRFTTPVSSSIVSNTMPDAVPGLCRINTSPATFTHRPAGIWFTCDAVRISAPRGSRAPAQRGVFSATDRRWSNRS